MENMNNASSGVSKSLPFVAMILISFAVIASSTLTKAAFASGLSQYVFVVYYDALGTLILLPFFLHHRLRFHLPLPLPSLPFHIYITSLSECGIYTYSRKRLPITFSLLCKFFILSLTGKCLFPVLIYTGLKYTSVTVTSALSNLTPIFTFLIAVCLRFERLNLSKFSDQLKTIGTFVSVIGAIVVTLYKGPSLTEIHDPSGSTPKLFYEQSKWLLGCLLFTLGFLLRSVWSIYQADTARLYPDELTIVFICNLFGTIQTAAAAFFLVEGQSSWKINNKIEIIAIVYAAFALSVVANTVNTWCLRKKGALFVSMFDPMSVAIAAVMGFAFLGDGIYLGSVVGSAIIVVGFYAVMWGQAKTTSSMAGKTVGLESASSQVVTPLLQSSHA